MAGKKGIDGAENLRKRKANERGGNAPKPDGFNRDEPDALAAWQEDYFTSLAVRNYCESTIKGRRDALKVFISWAQERDLTRAGEITRPILESFQRWLWRYQQTNGKPLSISLQRTRLGALKDWFSWMVRQNILLANPASESSSHA